MESCLKRSTLVWLFIFLIFTGMFSSCNFNKLFLHPEKLPADTDRVGMSSGDEKIVVKFSGDDFQPVFLRNGSDTLDPGFAIESLVFESANGNLLNGWLLNPHQITSDILLLHFHGNAGFLLSQYRAILPLVEQGFPVFMFDYSGFGFSQGEATRENVLIDALSAVEYVKNNHLQAGQKLVIYGQSLGGHVGAVVAAKKEEMIDGLVVEAAFSSHKDIANSRVPLLGRLLVREKYAATHYIGEYQKPLLVIHSTDDPIVPFHMGEKLYQNANEPKTFFKINGCHMCGPGFYGGQIATKIRRMVRD